jgi:multidrug resistance efflux pump
MASASYPGTASSPTLASGAIPVRRAAVSEPDSLGNDAKLVAEARQEIQSLVAEITKLAASECAPAEFYESFLSRVVTAMAAVGGAVWTRTPQGQFEVAAQHDPAQANLESVLEAGSAHAHWLRGAASQGQVVLLPPAGARSANEAAGNPTPYLLIAAPLIVERECTGIVEVFQRPGGTPAAQRGYARFLAQMAELAATYLQNRRYRQLEDNQSLWRELEAFVDAIHQSLDVRATAFAIVNDGRRLIRCDRLSLAVSYGGRCQVEAVSGLDSIDRRAGEAQSLAKLAEAVQRTGEPLWWNGTKRELPPQIEQPLDAHVDRSHARLVAVLPLVAGKARNDEAGEYQPRGIGRPLGALIVEQFGSAQIDEVLQQRANLAAHHSARALAAAVEHSSVFLLPLWRALGQATWLLRGRTLPKTLLALALAVGCLYALATVTTDFQIAARGKLQPAERREIFAQLDGVVAEVPVEHGQLVEAGAMLARLTSTDLDLQLASLLGRQTTNQERLTALSRALLDNKGGAARLSPADENRLAGEMLELRQEAENIEQELKLVRQKQQQLTIAAPMRGQVVTWKVHDLLLQRPVIRGQALLKLANPDGPWELELQLPERRLAHVERVGDAALEATFVLSSHPGQTFRGRVVEMDRVAEFREGEGNTVLLRVEVNKDELPPLHDQTTVTAKLHCGRTSIGYGWFGVFVETVQAKVLFWLPS